jgi:hypothetical protein
VLSAAEVSAHVAGTKVEAKTTRISAIPKTRVAEKAEIMAAARDGQPKSNVMMYAGSGLGVVAAAVIAFMVMKPTSKTGPDSTNSAAPPAATKTDSSGTLAQGSPTRNDSVQQYNNPNPGVAPGAGGNAGKGGKSPSDTLYALGSKMLNLDETDTIGFRTVLRAINQVPAKTSAELAYADIMRGTAMLHTGDKDKGCAKLSGAATNPALRADTTKQQLAVTTYTAYCKPE